LSINYSKKIEKLDVEDLGDTFEGKLNILQK